MAERTEIEKRVRRLIASDITYRVLQNLGNKGIRNLDKKVTGILEYIVEKEIIGDRVFAEVVYEPEDKKARKISEAISIFKEKHTKYGKILQNLIDEKRKQESNYLIYGLKQGFKLSEEDYVQVMIDLGFEKREASSIYPHVLSISERLKKADEQAERKILIKS